MRRYTETPFSLINALFDLVTTLLVIRMLLIFFGANAGNALVSFFYAISRPLVLPFAGIFQNGSFAGFTIEWSSVLALIAYTILNVIVLNLLDMLVHSDAHDHRHYHA